MHTVFLLMAIHNDAVLPLSVVAEKYLAMSPRRANEMAAAGTFPIPTFRLRRSQKSPRMVHLQDLANWIDKQRQEAVKQWHRSNDL
jgi:hypothetical protein